MATAITALANVTLASATNVITFSSINSGFQDLYLVITPIAPTTGGGVTLRFNSDTGTNYNRTAMWGTGSSASSGSTNGNSLGYFGGDSTSQAVITLHVFDYSATNKYKNFLSKSSQTNSGQRVETSFGTWKGTSAITSVSIINDSQNFSVGATFSLFGVLA